MKSCRFEDAACVYRLAKSDVVSFFTAAGEHNRGTGDCDLKLCAFEAAGTETGVAYEMSARIAGNNYCEREGRDAGVLVDPVGIEPTTYPEEPGRAHERQDSTQLLVDLVGIEPTTSSMPF